MLPPRSNRWSIISEFQDPHPFSQSPESTSAAPKTVVRRGGGAEIKSPPSLPPRAGEFQPFVPLGPAGSLVATVSACTGTQVRENTLVHAANSPVGEPPRRARQILAEIFHLPRGSGEFHRTIWQSRAALFVRRETPRLRCRSSRVSRARGVVSAGNGSALRGKPPTCTGVTEGP